MSDALNIDQSNAGEGTASQEAEAKVFKQEEVNQITAREAKKAQEKLLKKLGIADFNSAKEGMEKFRQWQETQKTEQEKQAEEKQKLEEEQKSLHEENTHLKAQLHAAQLGVKPDAIEDVVALAARFLGDDVDIQSAMQQVTDKHPYFLQTNQEDKPSFSTGNHQTTAETASFVQALGLKK